MGSGSGNRSKRKSALAVLEREGVPAAETISGYLSDMGMEDLAAELAPELLAEGSLEAVKRAWDRVQAKRMAAVIGIAARKAASVVEALKSHLENERTDGPAPIMLRESIQAAIALLSDELKGSAETKVDIGDQLVLGYPDSLGQVWMNLVKNSLQAMGGSGVLLVRAETRDSMVRVSFRDNGPGIDPETQSRLLDPYFSTKADSGGTGLGLQTCRQIVRRHGGSISFTSKPGETVFTVSLPLHSPATAL
jgi:signal transduction histidine kinase